AVMRRADGPQAGVPPGVERSGGDDRVSAFHAEDDAQGRRVRVALPGLPMRVQLRRRTQAAEVSLLLHQAVIGELGVGGAVGDVLVEVVEVRALIPRL